MSKIRLISSPRQDYLLAPEEFRRYSNHIIGYFLASFIVVFYLIWCLLFREQLPFFFNTILAYLAKNKDFLAEVKTIPFIAKASVSLLAAFFSASFFTQLMTKPVSRAEHLEGNFVDDSSEVFTNLAKDFAKHQCDESISLMRKGDFDYCNPLKPRKLQEDLRLPKHILELSFIVRGEAGGGKSVFLNRILKEVILAKQKAIVHNVKGDEFEALKGFCNFYLIEPWNEKAGYAINFYQLIARESKADRNSYAKLFAQSFLTRTSKSDAFFSESAFEVFYALILKIAEDNLTRGKDGKLICNGTLRKTVDLWISYKTPEVPPESILSDPLKLDKFVKDNNGSLEKIKNLLLEKNPTQADLIDVNNPKTSLCILATCTKAIKKIEDLAEFWKYREQTKSLDLISWLDNPADRQVILMSNSNQYSDVAEAYISAIINLLTVFVINPEYKPKTEVHFILDEFVQLSSINLKQFMKLPDVGRGKKIRVKIAMQRSSQVKEVFDVDPSSFVGAFQNKIWARPATDDLKFLTEELGKRTVKEYQSNANFNAQGQSSTMKVQTVSKEVVNPNHIQNELGPVKSGKELLGVRILLKFANFNRVAVATFPPVDFPKDPRLVGQVKRSKASSGASKKPPRATEAKEERELVEQSTQELVTTHQEPQHQHQHEEHPIGSAVLEAVSHAIAPEPIAIASQVADLLEAMENKSTNNNLVEINDEKQAIEVVRKRMLERRNKNKEIEI